MKKWQIKSRIEDFDLDLFVYVEAKIVLKTSHDTVVADGITITLPGEIESIQES